MCFVSLGILYWGDFVRFPSGGILCQGDFVLVGFCVFPIWGDIVPGIFCTGGIIYQGPTNKDNPPAQGIMFVCSLGGYCAGGILSWGDFVCLSFGGYCAGGLLSWGDYVRGDFVPGGILYRGDYGLHSPQTLGSKSFRFRFVESIVFFRDYATIL